LKAAANWLTILLEGTVDDPAPHRHHLLHPVPLAAARRLDAREGIDPNSLCALASGLAYVDI
jgi:hypothetical protein